MTLVLDTLKELRVAVEPAGSYGVAIALGSDFQPVPVVEGFAMPSPDREMLQPALMQGLIGSSSQAIPGKRMGSLRVDMVLGGHGLDCDGDVAIPAITAWPTRALIQTVLGGFSAPALLGSQVTVQALSTASAVVLSAGAGATLTPGQALAFLVGGSLEVGVIDSIASNTVTLKQALSGVPSGVVRHAIAFFITQNPDTSLQFESLGAEVDDHWRTSGMQAKSFAIEAPPSAQPKITIDFEGRGTQALSAHSGLGEVTHAHYSPIIASGGCITIFDYAPGVTAARTDPLVTDFKMTFAIAYEKIVTYCATDNIARMKLQRAAQGKWFKATFVVPFEDTSWATKRDNKTLIAIHAQIGSTVGATCLVEGPRMQVTKVSRANASGNLAGWSVECESLADTTNAATDLGRAPFRIHFV